MVLLGKQLLMVLQRKISLEWYVQIQVEKACCMQEPKMEFMFLMTMVLLGLHFKRTFLLVPVTDLTLKDNSLIVATQGRSLWMLDDLTVLHQMQQNNLGNQDNSLSNQKIVIEQKGVVVKAH